MKKKLWSAMVVGFCFVVSPLRGSEETLIYLPFGDNMLHWFVTNSPCGVTIILQNTNVTGGLNTAGMDSVGSFGSFQDFQSYVAVNGSRLLSYLGKENASEVRLRVNTTYNGLNSEGIQVLCKGLAVDTNLGPSAGITEDSFHAKLAPTTPSIVLPISGVSGVSIQLGTGSSVAVPIVGTNGIVWDSSFVTNSGRVRVWLTFNDGETVIYTQSGNSILAPIISMVPLSRGSNLCNLYVLGSAGADTVVESTTDFVSWMPVGGMSWDSSQTSTIIPIQPSSSSQFFRVRSY